MKSFIRNYFSYLYLASGNNTQKKLSVKKARQAFEDATNNVSEFEPITRVRFAKTLMDSLGINSYFTTEKKWLDENGNYKDYISALRIKYGFSWKDAFSDNYFQPEKKITI